MLSKEWSKKQISAGPGIAAPASIASRQGRGLQIASHRIASDRIMGDCDSLSTVPRIRVASLGWTETADMHLIGLPLPAGRQLVMMR